MKFTTVKHRLTRYALACGYIETAESSDQQSYAKLWAEHGVFFVRLTTSSGITSFATNRIETARSRLDQLCADHNLIKTPIPPEPI